MGCGYGMWVDIKGVKEKKELQETIDTPKEISIEEYKCKDLI